MFNSISIVPIWRNKLTSSRLRDQLGRCDFGEQYSDANGSSLQIVPPSQFKSAIAPNEVE